MATEQATIPGVDLKGPKHLRDKAEALSDIRKKRMKLQGDEADAQMVLVEGMKKEKLGAFQLDDGRVVVLTNGKEKVKIRTIKDDADEDAEE